MFEKREDFQYVNVKRLTDSSLAKKLLPERSKAAQRIFTLKDLAFIQEAVCELVDLGRISILGVITTEICPRIFYQSYKPVLPRLPLGNTLTILGGISGSWYNFDGIDVNKISNKVFADSDGEEWREILDSATIPEPRDFRFPDTIWPFPKENIYDWFFVFRMADCIVRGSGIVEDAYEGEMTYTVTTKEEHKDSDTGEWISKETKYDHDTEFISYHDSEYIEHAYRLFEKIEMLNVSGKYTYQIYCKKPGLVESALLIFKANRVAETNSFDGTVGTSGITERVSETQYHTIIVKPESFDSDKGVFTVIVSAESLTPCWSMLSKERPNLPELGTQANASVSSSVNLTIGNSPHYCLLKYKRRTSLKDVDWDYKPSIDSV